MEQVLSSIEFLNLDQRLFVSFLFFLIGRRKCFKL